MVTIGTSCNKEATPQPSLRDLMEEIPIGALLEGTLNRQLVGEDLVDVPVALSMSSLGSDGFALKNQSDNVDIIRPFNVIATDWTTGDAIWNSTKCAISGKRYPDGSIKIFALSETGARIEISTK